MSSFFNSFLVSVIRLRKSLLESLAGERRSQIQLCQTSRCYLDAFSLANELRLPADPYPAAKWPGQKPQRRK